MQAPVSRAMSEARSDRVTSDWPLARSRIDSAVPRLLVQVTHVDAWL